MGPRLRVRNTDHRAGHQTDESADGEVAADVVAVERQADDGAAGSADQAAEERIADDDGGGRFTVRPADVESVRALGGRLVKIQGKRRRAGR